MYISFQEFIGGVICALIIIASFLMTEQDRIDQMTLLCQLEPNDPVCETLPKE